MKTFFTFTLLMIISPVVYTTWSYSDITPAEVHSKLADGDTLVLLDVREISDVLFELNIFGQSSQPVIYHSANSLLLI